MTAYTFESDMIIETQHSHRTKRDREQTQMMPAYDPALPVVVSIADQQLNAPRVVKVQPTPHVTTYRRALVVTSIIFTIVIAYLVNMHMTYAADVTRDLEYQSIRCSQLQTDLDISNEAFKMSQDRLQTFVHLVHAMHTPSTIPMITSR